MSSTRHLCWCYTIRILLWALLAIAIVVGNHFGYGSWSPGQNLPFLGYLIFNSLIMFTLTTQNGSLKYVCTISHPKLMPTTVTTPSWQTNDTKCQVPLIKIIKFAILGIRKLQLWWCGGAEACTCGDGQYMSRYCGLSRGLTERESDFQKTLLTDKSVLRANRLVAASWCRPCVHRGWAWERQKTASMSRAYQEGKVHSQCHLNNILPHMKMILIRISPFLQWSDWAGMGLNRQPTTIPRVISTTGIFFGFPLKGCLRVHLLQSCFAGRWDTATTFFRHCSAKTDQNCRTCHLRFTSG